MPKPTEFHEAFARALAGVVPGGVTLDETGSTNDDARALAREGAPHLTAVVANAQASGRGRRGRAWMAEPGEALLASWVVRPPFPVERWTLVPLLVGVAAAEAVRARARVDATLKWPNDVLVGERKLAGILVEAEPPSFCVAGLGLNVSQTAFPPDLPATSLALESAVRLDRADLLAAVLRRFDEALREPEGALERYRALCSTLGAAVRVERGGGDPVEGVAERIEPDGALVVAGRRLHAGDVVHLRSLSPGTSVPPE